MSQNLPRRSLRHFLFYVILTIFYLRTRTMKTSSLPNGSIRPLFKEIGEIFSGIYSLRSPQRRASNSHTWPISRRFKGPVYFYDTFSRENRISTPCLECMRSIRYQKGKLVIKRPKNITFRSVGFADWFEEFKRYLKFAPKPF